MILLVMILRAEQQRATIFVAYLSVNLSKMLVYSYILLFRFLLDRTHVFDK